MGTILFIIFKLTGLIDTPVDYPLLCFLISLDSIAVPQLIGLYKKQ